MAEPRAFPERKFNQEDMMNNWLYAKPVEQGGKRPNFRVRMAGNSPRFVVKTNVANDTNNGRIEFNMDYSTFNVIMDTIKKIAEGKITEKVSFDYKANFLAGKKLDSMMTLSRVELGRHKDGRMYIAVRSTQNGRPAIAFTFEPSMNHGVAFIGDREITPKEISEMYALGFVRVHTQIMAQLLVRDFDEDGKGIAKPPQMQGGQQGGNFRGNNGGGYQPQRQQRSAPPADDFGESYDEFI